jgi:hypothetical protein
MEVSVVSPIMSSEELGKHEDAIATRLMILELAVATIAARLPKEDMEEVASVLVFVANSSKKASDDEISAGSVQLALAQYYATEMLERMTKVRRPGRISGARH